MIDPIAFLLLIFVSVGLSHTLLPAAPGSRLFWATTPGAVLLFITHPLALGFAVFCYAISLLLFFIGRQLTNTRIKTRLPYLILLLLFVPDVSLIASNSPILWLGSAFFIVRQMMTVAQGLKQNATPEEFVPGLLLATFFFAALPSGPVFNGLECWQQLRERRARINGEGIYRVIEGFIYLFAVAGFLSMATGGVRAGELAGALGDGLAAVLIISVLVLPLLAFGALFATFYGYSRMAEGTALLLGFEVPQNFNKPHLATDLGDFWKRWHRSMANFVMQYIYLPLLVTTSNARLALLAAFVFMGLWHNLSPGYLLWGIGHGVGLGYLLPWAQSRGLSPMTIRVGSLTYVVMLSGIAHGVWTS